MTKTLKDILALQPKTKDYSSKKLEGTDASTMTDLDGVDPEASYKGKASRDFAKKHKIEKHEDRVGNKDDVYKGKTKYALKNDENKHMGNDEAKAKSMYESIEEKVKNALGSRYINE